MQKGWYCGLNTRFSNHYYTKIKEDDIQSRCGQINLKVLKGKSITTLKPTKTKNNLCQGCINLLMHDEEQLTYVEPFRY